MPLINFEVSPFLTWLSTCDITNSTDKERYAQDIYLNHLVKQSF